MKRWLIRILALAGMVALARRIWRPVVDASMSLHATIQETLTGDTPVREEAVDHTRAPGVPPASNDDYSDPVDHDSADSFPASDPPARW
ncbi:MAG: hypothetical protein JWO69_1519 [Thermoleophilia bacterium]|jgi:hypothetical protein|nr:hypothetical protein [Thermoleophilia bacterium]